MTLKANLVRLNLQKSMVGSRYLSLSSYIGQSRLNTYRTAPGKGASQRLQDPLDVPARGGLVNMSEKASTFTARSYRSSPCGDILVRRHTCKCHTPSHSVSSCPFRI
ncbi:hypothetical protein ACJMK2_044774 [Sinanodonta woodiana]|uniref:Uncharacterized protein n=1 Tax=Sinanodonta woodiana TaxID=1069815 RepID=A0ABD3T2R4_SINWO